MKTLARKFYYMAAVVAAAALTLSSCEVDLSVGDNTLAGRESTGYLCSYVWEDEWSDADGYHRQELCFYPDRTGEDRILFRNRWGYEEEYRYVFTWDWYDAFYTSIRLNYGGGDYSFMDNMRMYDRQIDCLLDGYRVTFFGY